MFVLVHIYFSVQIVELGLGLWCFNATFNNIAATSWQSVLLVEETGVPGENSRPVSSTPRLSRIRTHNVSGDRHGLNKYM